MRKHIYDKHLNNNMRSILHKQVGECLEKLYTNREQIAEQ
jgi:hypothetical protein